MGPSPRTSKIIVRLKIERKELRDGIDDPSASTGG